MKWFVIAVFVVGIVGILVTGDIFWHCPPGRFNHCPRW